MVKDVFIYPHDLTLSRLKIAGLLGINYLDGSNINKKFLRMLEDTNVLDYNEKGDLILSINKYINSPLFDEQNLDEQNKKVENILINDVQYSEIKSIQKEYSDKKARWMPSGANEPSIVHEQFYGKIFDVDEGLYDISFKMKVIPGERYNCQCGMRILL